MYPYDEDAPLQPNRNTNLNTEQPNKLFNSEPTEPLNSDGYLQFLKAKQEYHRNSILQKDPSFESSEFNRMTKKTESDKNGNSDNLFITKLNR